MRELPPGLLEEITRRLVEELHPRQIILFGSHAWGTPTEDSDVDLMVVVSGADSQQRRELSLRARRALAGLRVPVDVAIRTHERMEQGREVYASLECEVLEPGKVLYDARDVLVRP